MIAKAKTFKEIYDGLDPIPPSRPTRACGLKQNDECLIMDKLGHAPHGRVD